MVVRSLQPVVRSRPLTSPDTATATKHQPAMTEYRATDADRSVPTRRTSRARAVSAPIQIAAPTRWTTIDDVAMSCPEAPAACPSCACCQSATSTIAAVQAAPVGVVTTSASAVTTAATVVISRRVRPRSICVTKTPSSAPNDAESSGRPATFAYVSTRCTIDRSVQVPAANPATSVLRGYARPSAVPTPARGVRVDATAARRGSTHTARTSAPSVTDPASSVSVSVAGRPQRTAAPGSRSSAGSAAPENATPSSAAATAASTSASTRQGLGGRRASTPGPPAPARPALVTGAVIGPA